MTLSCKKEACSCLLYVRDSGIGISPEVQKDLFAKRRVLSGKARPRSGAGLGLYITKLFMELNNGDVFLDSTGDSGSVFVFRLPLT